MLSEGNCISLITHFILNGDVKIHQIHLGCCGSVDWVWVCEPKGHQSESQSGHKPGLQARSGPQSGACVRPPMWNTHWCFSPSFLLPFSSKNKYINKSFKKFHQIHDIKSEKLIWPPYSHLKNHHNSSPHFPFCFIYMSCTF